MLDKRAPFGILRTAKPERQGSGRAAFRGAFTIDFGRKGVFRRGIE
jgi:hypothetical protein